MVKERRGGVVEECGKGDEKEVEGGCLNYDGGNKKGRGK